jgi:hypothetical protein
MEFNYDKEISYNYQRYDSLDNASVYTGYENHHEAVAVH